MKQQPLRRTARFVYLAPALVLASALSSADVLTFDVPMDGAQAGVPSPGTGFATVTLDTVTGAVSVDGTFSGLLGNVSVAHIHGPAPVGVPAGIVVGLSPSGGTSGTVTGGGTLTPAQVADELCGLHYINIHSSMFGGGEIRGQIQLSASAAPYGSGVNPAGSLTVTSGSAVVGGGPFGLGVDNPLGTQPAGSFALLGLSLAPDPAFPAGTSAPGLGMGSPGALGELLVDLPLVTLFPASIWTGAGNPAITTISLSASSCGLVGVTVYAQGAIFDPGANHLGLTNGLELTIGSI